jgi:hypothetical protein
MNITVTWNPGDTWRKLGYFYYTNSLDYRSVIEQNPQWDVMTEPPMGAVLSLDVNDSRLNNSLSVSGFFPDVPDEADRELIFPFEYRQQYESQAVKYSLYSLLNYDELNGYTQDTPQATTGIQ